MSGGGIAVRIAAFPDALGPQHREALRAADAIDQSYAYRAGSIEGYRVTSESIERVRAGNEAADGYRADRQGRDALAARGRWQGFRRVRVTVDCPGPPVAWFRQVVDRALARQAAALRSD